MKRAALIGVLLVALAVPASANAWTARLTVGSQVREWRSSQTFGKQDLLRLRVFTHGNYLHAEDASECVSDFYGYGLAVHVNACGPHLVVRVANSQTSPARLRIHYFRMSPAVT